MRASVGVALGFAVACGAVSMRAAADDVLVDVSSVTRSLPATFQGINYVGFWDSAQGSAASRDAIAQTGIKIVRFPGGAPADWYDWQCPYYTDTATPNCPSSAVASSWSSTSPLDVWNYANAFGGTVMFQTNFQGNLPNPPGQGYAVNSPENAAAWASYAQQQGMRALFEIGNEEDINMASVHDASFQPYITAFNAQAAAIHAADSSAHVIGPAGTNEYFWWALDSLGMFMAAAGNKTGTGAVDGVSLHFYTPDDWDSVVDTAQYWLGSGGPWEFIQATIAEHDTRPLPVYISEWHVGVPEAAFNATMAAALLTADLIGAFAVSGVAGQQYFTTHGVDADPNSWGLLCGAGESRATDTPTPTYYATVMWGKMGSDVLALTQSGDPATGVSSYATQKSDGSVQVLSINKSTSDQTVNVTFSGFDPGGRNVAVYTLSPSDGARTSQNVNYNGVENPSVQALPAPTSSAVSGATWSQPLAASSMVLMDFEGDGSATGGSGGATGGAPATGGSSGSGATAGVGAAAGTLGSGGVGGGSGSGGAAAANAAGGDAADDGGCACVATGASPRATLTGWLMLAAVALFARGRSRHARIRSSSLKSGMATSYSLRCPRLCWTIVGFLVCAAAFACDGSDSGGQSSAAGKAGAGGSGASAGSGASVGSGASAGSGGSGGSVGSDASAGTGASGGAGGTAGSGGSGGATIASDLIDADRITNWNPGILSDEQLHLPLGPDGLPVRTTVCATVNPGGNIQQAIDACPEGQVVALAAGTFNVSATVTLTKGVVLRGAGSAGAPSGTTIVKQGGSSVIAIGTDRDSICYGGTGDSLSQDAAKESATLSVGAAATNYQAGDLALIDVVDDSQVDEGDCQYFKRVDRRSASQRVEIRAVDAGTGTLTLSTGLHWSFPASSPYLAEITRVTRPTTRWAGVENLRIVGGTNPDYNGAAAGGIDISNAAYCWVKDVQTDDTIGGMHVALTGTYRCVVRDSYFHNSADYGFGRDCYGVVVRCGSADNLVENNIVRYMNKPILFNVSGGGNVVAYNYADNSWATPATWQEVNIDCHCSFPHMELMEGNYAPHMGASTTHGNAGFLTYFRNYASSQFASPPVVGSTASQTGNVTSLQFDGGDLGMNVLGNVLGTDGVSKVLDAYDSSAFSIFELGSNGAGAQDVAATTLYRHGNYDYVTRGVSWNPTRSNHTLPASFYRATQPAWWPAGTRWPWVGPEISPMVGVLPAKDRSDKIQ